MVRDVSFVHVDVSKRILGALDKPEEARVLKDVGKLREGELCVVSV